MSSRRHKNQTKNPATTNKVTPQIQILSPNPEAVEILKKYEQEVTKLLLSNSVEYIRTTSQQLQTVTGILLSSYIAIFFGLGKQFGLPMNFPTWAYSIPIVCFTISLIGSFVIALFGKTSKSTPGDWVGAESAFSENLKNRQRQIYLPAVFSLLGLISFASIAVWAW